MARWTLNAGLVASGRVRELIPLVLIHKACSHLLIAAPGNWYTGWILKKYSGPQAILISLQPSGRTTAKRPASGSGHTALGTCRSKHRSLEILLGNVFATGKGEDPHTEHSREGCFLLPGTFLLEKHPSVARRGLSTPAPASAVSLHLHLWEFPWSLRYLPGRLPG